MKCPGCKFVCSDLRDVCPKCLLDLRPAKTAMHLPITNKRASYDELLAKMVKKSRHPRKTRRKKKKKGEGKTIRFMKRLLRPTEEVTQEKSSKSETPAPPTTTIETATPEPPPEVISEPTPPIPEVQEEVTPESSALTAVDESEIPIESEAISQFEEGAESLAEDVFDPEKLFEEAKVKAETELDAAPSAESTPFEAEEETSAEPSEIDDQSPFSDPSVTPDFAEVAEGMGQFLDQVLDETEEPTAPKLEVEIEESVEEESLSFEEVEFEEPLAEEPLEQVTEQEKEEKPPGFLQRLFSSGKPTLEEKALLEEPAPELSAAEASDEIEEGSEEFTFPEHVEFTDSSEEMSEVLDHVIETAASAAEAVRETATEVEEQPKTPQEGHIEQEVFVTEEESSSAPEQELFEESVTEDVEEEIAEEQAVLDEQETFEETEEAKEKSPGVFGRLFGSRESRQQEEEPAKEFATEALPAEPTPEEEPEAIIELQFGNEVAEEESFQADESEQDLAQESELLATSEPVLDTIVEELFEPEEPAALLGETEEVQEVVEIEIPEEAEVGSEIEPVLDEIVEEQRIDLLPELSVDERRELFMTRREDLFGHTALRSSSKVFEGPSQGLFEMSLSDYPAPAAAPAIARRTVTRAQDLTSQQNGQSQSTLSHNIVVVLEDGTKIGQIPVSEEPEQLEIAEELTPLEEQQTESVEDSTTLPQEAALAQESIEQLIELEELIEDERETPAKDAVGQEEHTATGEAHQESPAERAEENINQIHESTVEDVPPQEQVQAASEDLTAPKVLAEFIGQEVVVKPVSIPEFQPETAVDSAPSTEVSPEVSIEQPELRAPFSKPVDFDPLDIRLLFREARRELRHMSAEGSVEFEVGLEQLHLEKNREHIRLLFELSREALSGEAPAPIYEESVVVSTQREIQTDFLEEQLKETTQAIEQPVFNLRQPESLEAEQKHEHIKKGKLFFLASGQQRFFAGALDVLVTVGCALFTSLTHLEISHAQIVKHLAFLQAPGVLESLTILEIVLLHSIIWFFLFPMACFSFFKTLPGLQTFGLKIIRENGREPRLSHLWIRTSVIPLSFLCGSAILPFFSRTTLHERLSRTRVCERQEEEEEEESE